MMNRIVLLLLLCAETIRAGQKCLKPRVRKEWRRLNDIEKSDYIDAVKCLWSSPARGGASFPVKTRHDDFAAMHFNATGAAILTPTGEFAGMVGPGIHHNGVFLPWHRYLLWAYESALQAECNYKGAQPYWDWSLDNPENGGAQFERSPIFDPNTGFGGNGEDGTIPIISAPDQPPVGVAGEPIGSCIVDGPFAHFDVVLNPGPANNGITASKRCLKRNFQPHTADISAAWNANVVPLLNLTVFANFSLGFDFDVGNTGSPAGIHGAGHQGVGGEMFNVWSSINDPLFYLHHGNLDRIWDIWQKKHPSNLYAIGAPRNGNGSGGETTLDDLVYMSDFVTPTVPIRQVMDPLNQNHGGLLCYVYA